MQQMRQGELQSTQLHCMPQVILPQLHGEEVDQKLHEPPQLEQGPVPRRTPKKEKTEGPRGGTGAEKKKRNREKKKREMEGREEGKIKITNAKEEDCGGDEGQCGYECIRRALNKGKSVQITLKQLKGQIVKWLNNEENAEWKRTWTKDTWSTQEMEDGPPIESPQGLVDAIARRPKRWICKGALAALAKLTKKDIVILTGGKDGKYNLSTWVKGEEERKRNDEDLIVLVLNREHYRLLWKPEHGWPEELKKAQAEWINGERAGMREGSSEQEDHQEERENPKKHGKKT